MGLPRAPNVPEQVVQFAPKEKAPHNSRDALDQAGQSIVALLEQAANTSNERCERAMDAAHKLSKQLRAAEDRIKHLQAERDHFQDRATRAEEWLTRVYHEVKEKLISPRSGSHQALRQ
jgi:exonuclease VII small subunit